MPPSNMLPASFGSAVPKAGCAEVGWFRSEFGCVGLSSFESMSAQLPESEWSVHSSAMFYRTVRVFSTHPHIESKLLQQRLELTVIR